MNSPLYDPAAPKKATNLSVNSDLLRKARELGVNLSWTLEECLKDLLAQERERKWLAENEEAIKSYNSRAEAEGVFSDSVRRF